MFLFSRTDQSHFARWWWTVDRWLLATFFLLALIGIFLVAAASPAAADRMNISNPNHFIIRHLVLLVPSLAGMLIVSFFSIKQLRLLALAVFGGSIIGIILTLLIGVEIKGGQRWLHLPGFSLQPSEFVKPSFIILTAWLFAHPAVRGIPLMKMVPGLLLALVVGLLLMQPDLGMSFVVGAVWLGQLFLAGLPIYLVVIGILTGIGGLIGAYFALPHVTSRINRFLNPESGDTYQIDRAAEAFQAGGIFGTGLGQGTVKDSLPDAHADFIFAVAGEELGMIWCLVIITLVGFVVLRGLWRAGQGETLFISLAASGLVMQFGLQAFINIGSALHLLPTKGMTLPFISYGGSSLLAIALGMGMLLALTRKRTG